MNCVLENRECNDCGECDRCDIDEIKRCDNCCMCLENPSGGLRTILIRKDQIKPDKPQVKDVYRSNPPQKEKG